MTQWVIVCSEEERKKMKTFKRREILSVQEDENGVCIEERFDPSEEIYPLIRSSLIKG